MAPLYWIAILLGMTLVTCLPRMLPLAVFHHLRPKGAFRTFLGFIPPALLASLTLPAALASTPTPLAAILALAVALVLALLKRSPVLVILGGVAAAVAVDLLR